MKKSYLQSGLLIGLSAILTASLGFLGGTPLRTLRQVGGPTLFWLLGCLMSVSLFAGGAQVLAVCFLALFIGVGFFIELEDAGLSMAAAALGSVAVIGVFTGASLAFWISANPSTWLAELVTWVTPLHEQVLALRPDFDLTPEALLLQLPGLLALILMVTIYFSVIGERVFSRWCAVELHSSKDLRQFRIPDEFVWVLLFGLLAGFYKHEISWLKYLGLNTVVFALAAYFFQGLSVVSHFFAKMKAGPFFKIIGYALLVTQLAVLVSLLGVADIWLEFRSPKRKGTQKEKLESKNF